MASQAQELMYLPATQKKTFQTVGNTELGGIAADT